MQAQAAVFLEEEGAFEAGQFEIVEVFDIGGDRYPKVNETLDFFAFFHEPHYVLAEAAPLVQVRDGAGPGSGAADDRRERAAPVRVHGARPRAPGVSRRWC